MRLCPHRAQTRYAKLHAHIFKSCDERIDDVVVAVTWVQLVCRTDSRDESTRIGIVFRKVICRDEDVGVNLARTQIGRSEIRGHEIVRRAHEARDHVACACKSVLDITRRVDDLDDIANLHGFVEHGIGCDHALARSVRPASFDEDGTIDVGSIIAIRAHTVRRIRSTRRVEVKALEAHDVLLVAVRRIGIGHTHALDASHALDLRDCLDVSIVQAERAGHVEIAHVRVVIELVCRDVHVNRGHEQTGKKPAAERRNDGNRQETPHGMRDGATYFLVECACHESLSAPYHSIESAVLGVSFSSTEATLPSWMWMTRWAMGLKAVLCVMRTTVRPCTVDASCNKCKMALPVL